MNIYCFNINVFFSIKLISNKKLFFGPKIKKFLSPCNNYKNIMECRIFIEESKSDIRYKKIFNRYDIVKYRNELSNFYYKKISFLEQSNYHDWLPYTFYNFLSSNGLLDILDGEFIFFHKSKFSVIFNIRKKKVIVFSLCKNTKKVIFDENILFFILSVSVVLNEGFILHSAFIMKSDKGYLFCGNSGAGKSTITQLLGVENAFNDEAVIILKENDKWVAVPTPFYQYEIVDKLSFSITHNINGLMFLYKSSVCNLRRINKFNKLHRIEFILKNLIHFNVIFTPPIMKKLFNKIIDFSKDIPFYDFYCNLNKEEILLELEQLG